MGVTHQIGSFPRATPSAYIPVRHNLVDIPPRRVEAWVLGVDVGSSPAHPVGAPEVVNPDISQRRRISSDGVEEGPQVIDVLVSIGEYT
jgi:hypothetical protein